MKFLRYRWSVKNKNLLKPIYVKGDFMCERRDVSQNASVGKLQTGWQGGLESLQEPG